MKTVIAREKTQARTKEVGNREFTEIDFGMVGRESFEKAAMRYHQAVRFIPALRGSRLGESHGDDFNSKYQAFKTANEAFLFHADLKSYPCSDQRRRPSVKASLSAGELVCIYQTSSRSAGIEIVGRDDNGYAVSGKAWVPSELTGAILRNLRKAGFAASTVREAVCA